MKEKCRHPNCNSFDSHHFVNVPTIYGYEIYWYCHIHKSYGKELAQDERKRILDIQRRINSKPKQQKIVFFDLFTGQAKSEALSHSKVAIQNRKKRAKKKVKKEFLKEVDELIARPPDTNEFLEGWEGIEIPQERIAHKIAVLS